MPLDVNRIPPEENGENRAPNELLRRSGGTGDICLQYIIFINVTLPFILYSLAYDHQYTFSSTFCSQDLSNKHSKAHVLVHSAVPLMSTCKV